MYNPKLNNAIKLLHFTFQFFLIYTYQNLSLVYNHFLGSS